MQGLNISHTIVDETIEKPVTWYYLNFYLDDLCVGFFKVASDGRVEIELNDQSKELIRKKLVPKLAEHPSIVESISAELDLRSPLEM